MSAYMVDREHVIFLVKAAISRRLSEYDGGSIRWFYNDQWHQIRCTEDVETLASVAQMLWDANLKSIHTRYPDTIDKPQNTPGPIGEDWIIKPSDFRKYIWLDFSVVQVVKSIHCLEYQSCEFEEWEESEAYAFLKALERKCLNAMPGYDAAEWGFPPHMGSIKPKPAKVMKTKNHILERILSN